MGRWVCQRVDGKVAPGGRERGPCQTGVARGGESPWCVAFAGKEGRFCHWRLAPRHASTRTRSQARPCDCVLLCCLSYSVCIFLDAHSKKKIKPWFGEKKKKTLLGEKKKKKKKKKS